MKGMIFYDKEKEDELRLLFDVIIPNDVYIKVDYYMFRAMTYITPMSYYVEVEMDSKDWAKMKRKYFKNREKCNLPGVIHIDTKFGDKG